MAAEAWFYVQGGNRIGPVNKEELRARISAGTVRSSDTVWREGMAEWTPAGKVEELASASSTPPPVTGGKAMAFSPGLRVLAIIGAILAIGAFFAPYFYTKAALTMDDSLLALQNAGDKRMLDDAMSGTWTAYALGWSYWYGIVAFGAGIGVLIFSILDLSMRRIKVMRIINQWMIFVASIAIIGAAGTGLTLGIFKIGVLTAVPPAGDVVDSSVYDAKNTKAKKWVADLRKENKVAMDAAKPEDRDALAKQQIKDKGDPALWDKALWSITAIPIAASAPVLGGVFALIASLLMISKKK